MDRDALGTTLFTLLWVGGIFVVGVPYLIVSRGPDRLSDRSGPVRYLGLPLIAAGALLYVWSTRELTEPGGTPAPTHEPADLVTSGPYRYTRNPFYVSVLAVLAGEALLFEHLGLAAYVGAMWVYFEALVVGYEEPRLRERYGEDYEAYCETVPRWVAVSR